MYALLLEMITYAILWHKQEITDYSVFIDSDDFRYGLTAALVRSGQKRRAAVKIFNAIHYLVDEGSQVPQLDCIPRGDPVVELPLEWFNPFTNHREEA